MKSLSFVAICLLVTAPFVRAQISPGELSRAHGSLGGATRCVNCHDLTTRPPEYKCLECHKEIRLRLDEKRGLHPSLVGADRTGRPCAACHSEHNGRDSSLIRWDTPVARFDHHRTGYTLEGKHHSPGISRQILSWLHRIAGTALIFFPVLTFVRHWKEYRVHLYNIEHAWNWATGDLKWLVLMIPASVNRRIVLPDQGKFNAAEKLNFLMVLCTYPLFVATGLLIWMPDRVVLFWIVHVGMALIATPLMLGHIYMALINPGTRVGLSGMLSGYVDRHWAMHHYRLWYRENFEGDAGEAAKRNQAPHQRRKSPIVVLRFVTAGRKPRGISIQALPADQDPAGELPGNGGGC